MVDGRVGPRSIRRTSKRSVVVARYDTQRNLVHKWTPSITLNSRSEFSPDMGVPMPRSTKEEELREKLYMEWKLQSHAKEKRCTANPCNRRTCGFAHSNAELHHPRLEEPHNRPPCRFFSTPKGCFKGSNCPDMHNDFNLYGFPPDSCFAGLSHFKFKLSSSPRGSPLKSGSATRSSNLSVAW